MRLQYPPGLVTIGLHLRHQCLHAVELRLGPDERVKFDLDMLTVKVFIEVEEIGFEQFLRRIEAWADAEIGGPVQHASIR